jgi:protein phosphatase
MRPAALLPAAPRLSPGAQRTLGHLSLTVLDPLERDCRQDVWRARGEDGATYEVVDSPAASIAPPAALAPAVRVPSAEVEEGGRCLRVYPEPEGVALADLLRQPQPVEVALETMGVVARAFGHVHEAGHLVLGLYPERLRIAGATAQIQWEGPFPRLDDPSPVLAPTPGFSAPEAFGRGEGKLSPATDVFALGMLLYYLLTGAPRIPEAAEVGVDLPRPRAWRPDLPFGIEGVFRRATQRLASRRTPDVAAFLADLERARDRIAARAALPYGPARHAVAADAHIGLSKAKQRPVNEDALLVRREPARAKAMLLVADGVSHATLGSGDEASRILVAAAAERWERLCGGRLLSAEVAPRVAENLLLSVVRAANDAIAARASLLAGGKASADAEVMATTAVLALADGNRAHLLNLGDSRAYLFSGGEIEAMTCDHDVRHEMLRKRRPLAEVAAAAGGSQLTRYVGRLEPRAGAFVPVDPEPDFVHIPLFPEDRLLLCSDGLSDYVGMTEREADEAIARVLGEFRDPARAAFELVVLANRAGGGDNITCIVLDVHRPEEEAPWPKN